MAARPVDPLLLADLAGTMHAAVQQIAPGAGVMIGLTPPQDPQVVATCLAPTEPISGLTFALALLRLFADSPGATTPRTIEAARRAIEILTSVHNGPVREVVVLPGEAAAHG